MLGNLVVNGRPMPIRHIGLQLGLIVFAATCDGSEPLPEAGTVHVFDPAGGLVLSAPWAWPAREPVDRDAEVTVLFPVRITDVTHVAGRTARLKRP